VGLFVERDVVCLLGAIASIGFFSERMEAL